MLGYLQGTHCEYQNALDGHKSDSYAHEAVDGPRRCMAGTARMGDVETLVLEYAIYTIYAIAEAERSGGYR